MWRARHKRCALQSLRALSALATAASRRKPSREGVNVLDWIGGLAQAVIAGVLAEIINETLREAKSKRLADKARHLRR